MVQKTFDTPEYEMMKMWMKNVINVRSKTFKIFCESDWVNPQDVWIPGVLLLKVIYPCTGPIALWTLNLVCYFRIRWEICIQCVCFCGDFSDIHSLRIAWHFVTTDWWAKDRWSSDANVEKHPSLFVISAIFECRVTRQVQRRVPLFAKLPGKNRQMALRSNRPESPQVAKG